MSWIGWQAIESLGTDAAEGIVGCYLCKEKKWASPFWGFAGGKGLVPLAPFCLEYVAH